MIVVVPAGTANDWMADKPFTGKPIFRSTAYPSKRAVMIGDRLVKPRDVYEMVFFGRPQGKTT